MKQCASACASYSVLADGTSQKRPLVAGYGNGGRNRMRGNQNERSEPVEGIC